MAKFDKSHSINGVSGCYFYAKNPGFRAEGCHDAQKWVSESRPVKGYGEPTWLRVNIRFDDQCGNKNNSFAITGDIYGKKGRDIAGGCLHDDIAAVFPELKHLIKWHLSSTDGPMHYLANTIYFAGDRDSRGRRAGEPSQYDHIIYFGNSPVHNKFKSDEFRAFLLSRLKLGANGCYYLPKESGEFSVQSIEYVKKQGGVDYQFDPNYTFTGFGKTWYDCPFDSRILADEWAKALNGGSVRFASIPTAYSQGKARELDSARSAAVWPEATDEQLSVDSEELRLVLEARLPGLIAAFKADIEAIGFKWLAE